MRQSRQEGRSQAPEAVHTQVFTVGGSYSGGKNGGKDGEVYESRPGSGNGTWRVLPGASAMPLLTEDLEGVYRADNHAWLCVPDWETPQCRCVPKQHAVANLGYLRSSRYLPWTLGCGSEKRYALLAQ